MIPIIGQIVYYKSLGSADGKFKSENRAAIVTYVYDVTKGESFLDCLVDLCVFNPEGFYFAMAIEHGDEAGEWNWMPSIPKTEVE